ncbi:MAG: tetratricopeptide repeat protein [Sphingomonadaceae bacterium]
MSRAAAASGTMLAPLAIGFLLADGAAAEAKATLPAIQPVDDLPARSAGTTIERGKAELRAGRPADAVAAFREALAADPQSVEALSGMAVAYDQLGRHDLSRPLYEAALILDPRSPVLLYNYGLSLHLQRDRAGALRFLGLAAAGGDAEVETAALKLIARLDPQRMQAAGPQQASAAPAQVAEQQPPERPAMRTAGVEAGAAPAIAPATAPGAAALPRGPALVRTSEHEVRLVLAPAAAAPAPLVAELGADAVAALPVAGLSAREDAAIQAREEAAVAAEALALARAEAARREAEALAALAPALRETLAAAASAAAPGRAPGSLAPAAVAAPARPLRPEPSEQVETLLASSTPEAGPPAAGRLEAQQILALALAQPALGPQRRNPQAREARLLPPAEPQPRPRRAFEAPFDSDDARLNGFARRVQSGEADPAVAIARLEALLERLQAA